MRQQIEQAVKVMKSGGVIAYPTEAVFGLGCDINNTSAVNRIINMKQRDPEQGLIIVAFCWSQVEKFTKTTAVKNLEEILSSWPGPTTWVFPASSLAPKLITGKHKTIAIRISKHPIVQAITQEANMPIVSTSANKHGKQAAKTNTDVQCIFANEVDYCINAAVGDLNQPTTIINALNGKIIR